MGKFLLFSKRKKDGDGDLTTELKDLEVDRVDGVDRPATGRAFALSKSRDQIKKIVTGDMEQIAAVLKELYPSEEERTKRLIAQACDDCIVKCIGADKVLVGYIVKGSDVSSPLMSFESAVALVARAIKGELAAGRRAAGKPLNDEDPMMTHLSPGVAAPLDDTEVNVDPTLARQFDDDEEKPTLWEQHRAKGDGVQLDGTRWPRTKSAKAARGPRIVHRSGD